MFPCELIFINVLNKCRVKINHLSLCFKKIGFHITDLSRSACMLLMSPQWTQYNRERERRETGGLGGQKGQTILIYQFITFLNVFSGVSPKFSNIYIYYITIRPVGIFYSIFIHKYLYHSRLAIFSLFPSYIKGFII